MRCEDYTMSSNMITASANALRRAKQTATTISPLTETYPELTVEDAYAVQVEQVTAWTAAGRKIIGYKVGLTSRAMQEQIGVDQPDYGHLFVDMMQYEHGRFDLDQLISPRVEPEIAFVLRSPLRGPGITPEDVLAAIDYAVASLEIVDSRIADWRIRLEDTVADNGSAAEVVLGTVHVPATSLDLAGLEVRLSVNGVEVSRGTGAAVLGSPLNAVAWLANTLGEHGVTLEAGHLILPGAMVASASASAGDVMTADFDHLGSVSATFTGTNSTPARDKA